MILQTWEATTAKRMETDQYCQRKNHSSLNVLSAMYCIDYCDIASSTIRVQCVTCLTNS